MKILTASQLPSTFALASIRRPPFCLGLKAGTVWAPAEKCSLIYRRRQKRCNLRRLKQIEPDRPRDAPEIGTELTGRRNVFLFAGQRLEPSENRCTEDEIIAA
jgi:hypothetical protein